MNETQRVRLPVLKQTLPVELDVPLALPEQPFLPPDAPVYDSSTRRADKNRTLRTSSYTIFVDLEDNDEELLLIHGYTGAYDKVSRRVAAYLRSLEVGSLHKPLHGEWSQEPSSPTDVQPPLDSTIQRLKKRGYLTQMTLEEEEGLFARDAANRHFRASRQAPAYILIPTYQCNLRCPYCFQDHMRTDPSYEHLLRIMQPGMADRLIQGMSRIEAAHGIPEGSAITRNITFFGGEPLLEESHHIIEYILHKIQGLGRASFSAITNGTDLHAYKGLLGPGKIGYLQITVDGPPAEHDKRRIYADGTGSFERIAGNIDMALELGVKISIRMNIDRNNVRTLPTLGDEFVARGWTRHPGFSSYVSPVHGYNERTSAKTTYSSWELNQALAQLQQQHPSVRRIGGTDDGLAQRVRQIFDKRANPLPTFKSDFCGAHTSMYILDSFGDIYACWERTGEPSIRIGAIDESGEVKMNRALTDTWRSRNVTSNPVCRRCRYASYCGGGCAVLAEAQNGDLHSNHCDGFSKRFRNVVAMAYGQHVAGVEFTGQADRVCDL